MCPRFRRYGRGTTTHTHTPRAGEQCVEPETNEKLKRDLDRSYLVEHREEPLEKLGGIVLLALWETLRVAKLDSLYEETRRSEEHTSELQSRPHLVCRL